MRAPNHLGDVVLALPTLLSLRADVMVVSWLRPILDMAGVGGEVLSLDRGPRAFLESVRGLRRRRYRRGILLSAAFSAAWLFRCGGVRRLRGTRTDARGWLLREPVDTASLRGLHRVDAFRLVAGLPSGATAEPLRIEPPEERVATWRARLEESEAGPLAGVFPGAHAAARRWPPERFAALVAQLGATGRVVVLGGPGERALTARVAGANPRVQDLGGQTDLIDLAAVLRVCDLVVTNDTGPMHLAGAVGTPTVSLWGSSDPEEVRQTGAADVPVTGADLPCRPCCRNQCHRRGSGTLLADAHVECMNLIQVEDVMEAVQEALDGMRA